MSNQIPRDRPADEGAPLVIDERLLREALIHAIDFWCDEDAISPLTREHLIAAVVQ